MQYPTQLNAAAGVTIAAILAGDTTFASGGNIAIAGGLVRSKSGRPNTVLRVNAKNFQEVLGSPYHRSHADRESMRHLWDVLKEGEANVVRVVSSDAKYPLINLLSTSAFDVSASSYDTVPSLPVTNPYLTFHVKDGADAANRKIVIETNADNEFFNIVIVEVATDLSEKVLKTHKVSLDIEALDDFARPAYILDVLDRDSQYIGVEVEDGIAYDKAVLDTLSGGALFVGGTDGGTPSQADYQTAADLLGNSNKYMTAILGFGLMEQTVLQSLAAYADKRLIPFYYDLAPASTYVAALATKDNDAINSFRAQAYHFPYVANDPFNAGLSIWGLSGVAFSALARGLKIVSGQVAGVHFSNAGIKRASLGRSGIEPLENTGVLDRVAFTESRINPVAFDENGNAYIDDSLTCRPIDDYLKHGHVSRIMDEISKGFYVMANTLKHEPDGITTKRLDKGMRRLLDSFVTSGALVKPRDENDSDDEYTYTIEQTAFDLWTVKWSVSPTGVARRILGQPHILR